MKTLTFILGICLSLLTQPLMAANFTVDIAADDADAHDTNPGDGVCSDTLGYCTLRAAIEEANATAAADVILFDTGFVDARLVLAASEGPLPPISTPIHILAYGITAYNSSATLLRDAPPQFTIDGNQLNSGNGLIFSNANASGSVVSALAIVNFPSDGIVMALGADNISVNRSYIGVNSDGTSGGNGGHGINAAITDSHNIGKARHSNGNSFVSLGNVISQNGGSGIRMFDSNDNTVHGNIIGMAPTGTSDRGNGAFGIYMYGDNNQVGDFIGTTKAGNFIAANHSGGISIDGDNNRIYTNELGKGETGGFINSEGHGISVLGDANFIGTGQEISGNKIYEHEGAGISLGITNTSEANNNFVMNNSVGSSGAFSSLSRSGNSVGIIVYNGNTNVIADNRVINSGIDGGDGDGIYVRGDNNSVTGNQVGFVDILFGSVASEPNTGYGIYILGDGNTIGSEGLPNLVGGNLFTGIRTIGDSNAINYNHIGVGGAFQPIGNEASGLVVTHNGFGLEIKENVIGSNSGTGMYLIGDVNVQSIHNNYIGVTPDGADVGNEVYGIAIESTTNIEVYRNRVAFNDLGGIAVFDSSDGVAIWQNYMFENGGLAIDLGADGITANDAGDFDEGANRLQNTPVIESIFYDEMANPKTITIGYRVDSNTSVSTYPLHIDFYWSGLDLNSQGRHFLGTDVNYTTQNALKSVTFNFNSSHQGALVTATALDQERNTSEMSPQFQFGTLDIIFKDGFK